MKWTEWLIVGVLLPVAVLIIQKFLNRKKDKVELTNLMLEAKSRINDLSDKKARELEEEAEELKDQMRRDSLRYKATLDSCIGKMQELEKNNTDLIRNNAELLEQLKTLRKLLDKSKK